MKDRKKSKRKLEEQHLYKDPVVTDIVPFLKFYVAEDYHRNYYENHKDAPYCRFIIEPKISKLGAVYRHELKDQPR
jgi:peptide-methionine (S)-S-oxide reductase